MDKAKLERINTLSKKSKTEGLTEAEKSEQAALRAEYIGEFRASLKRELDNTYIQRPDGSKEKLKPKS